MEITELSLPQAKLLRPKIFFDERGFFRETFRKPLYEEAGIESDFVQDNHSFSQKGTIRGMHFQRALSQAKLITVMEGKIFDVIVDIRPESPHFGKWEGVYLDAALGEQLFVPAGYAHGFCVVSEQAHVFYKVSTLYDPLEERSFCYNDPTIGIVWPVADPVLSDRDRNAPLLYPVPSGFVNLDSARQSKIEAKRPNEKDHSRIGKADEKDRFCKAAASPNSQNLTERGIEEVLE